MARIDMPDGSWVEARLPTTDEYLALLDRPDDTPRVAVVREARDLMNAACSATSWGGRPSDLPPLRLVGLGVRWVTLAEDDAVPPASGTGSVTTSQAQGSPATDEG